MDRWPWQCLTLNEAYVSCARDKIEIDLVTSPDIKPTLGQCMVLVARQTQDIESMLV